MARFSLRDDGSVTASAAAFAAARTASRIASNALPPRSSAPSVSPRSTFANRLRRISRPTASMTSAAFETDLIVDSDATRVASFAATARRRSFARRFPRRCPRTYATSAAPRRRRGKYTPSTQSSESEDSEGVRVVRVLRARAPESSVPVLVAVTRTRRPRGPGPDPGGGARRGGFARAPAPSFFSSVSVPVSRAPSSNANVAAYSARVNLRPADVTYSVNASPSGSLPFAPRRERNGAEPGGAPPPAVPSTNRPTSRTSPPSLAYIAAIARSRATDGNPVPRTRHVFGADPNCDVSTTSSATAVRSVVGANRIVTITSPFAGTTPRLGSTVNGPEVAFRVAWNSNAMGTLHRRGTRSTCSAPTAQRPKSTAEGNTVSFITG